MDPVVLLDFSPSSIVSLIKEALTCGLLAVVISTGVYGITVLQAYMYFRSSKEDSASMRAFVSFLFVLGTISLCLAVDGLYEYVVKDFGETWLLLKLPRSLEYENGVTYLIAAVTQCFYAHRIWALSRWNIALVSTIVIISLAAFGVSIVICVRNYINPDFVSISSPGMRCLVGISNGLNVLCDVTITKALSYYLHSKRTGFKRTDSIINRLIVYAVNRGALTAICQATVTILYVAFPGHLYHLPFDVLNGKLYGNALFATLNAQKAMRIEGDNVMKVGTFILNQVGPKNASTGGSGTSRAHASNSTKAVVVDISPDNWKAMDSEHTPSGGSNV